MAPGRGSPTLRFPEVRVPEGSPLSLSTIGCPRISRSTIPRPRITAELSELEWRIVLVTGGAATGKTVALAQWFDTLEDVAREWMTISSADDRPSRWWTALLTTLDRAAPGAFAGSLSLVAEGRSSEDVVNVLLVELAMLESECLLVLDDIHLLRNAEIWSSMNNLLERLPRNAHIVMISRCNPQIPFTLWCARGWLKQIRQSDLAFTLPEAMEYLAMVDKQGLTPDDVKEIWSRSEGWVAYLVLLAAQIRRHGAAPDVVRRFSEHHSMVFDLLMDEVIDVQSDDIVDFMLRTSVLNVLDPELCDAVSGRNDSRDLLQLIEAAVPFMTAVEGEGTYRYHTLLSEALRSQLDLRIPGAAAEIASTAANVCECRGDHVSAVGYHVASGNQEAAFSTSLRAGLDRYDHGDVGAAAAWIDLLPTDRAAESVPLMLTRAVGLSIIGRAEEALAWTERAAIRFEKCPQEFVREAAVADALRLHAFATSTGLGDGIESGRRALSAADQGVDLSQVPRFRPDMVRGYLLVDQPEAAQRVLDTYPPDEDELARLIAIPGLRARILDRMGQLTEALELTGGAMIAVRALGAKGHLGELDARLAEASLLAERNHIGEAEISLKELLSSLELHPDALVYRVLLSLEQVRLAVALKGLDEGLAIIDEARALLGARQRPALAAMIDAVAVRWCLEAGLERSAEAVLSALPSYHRQRPLLVARLDLVRGLPDECMAKLEKLEFSDRRRRLERELLRIRAAVALNDPKTASFVNTAVQLAAPQGIALAILEEGPVVTRLVRGACDEVESSEGQALAHALGAPPRTRTRGQSDSLLSDRELSVLRFLPTRLTNQEIAQECCMSVNTVKTHVKHIYEKLGVSTRAAAGDRARTLGLL